MSIYWTEDGNGNLERSERCAVDRRQMIMSSIGLLAASIFNSRSGEASVASQFTDSNRPCFLSVGFHYYFFDLIFAPPVTSVYCFRNGFWKWHSSRQLFLGIEYEFGETNLGFEFWGCQTVLRVRLFDWLDDMCMLGCYAIWAFD